MINTDNANVADPLAATSSRPPIKITISMLN